MAEAELRACQSHSACHDAARLSLLAGYLRLSDGDALPAGKLLSGGEPSAELAPYLAFYRGQAEFYSGDVAAAAASFEAAAQLAPPTLAPRAKARAGEALFEAGRPQEALPYLEQAVAAMQGPELLFERALARAAAGDAKGEAEDLRVLAVRYPDHPYADRALELLPPLDRRPLTFAERLNRAEALLDTMPQRALEEVSAIRKARLPRLKPDFARLALVALKAHYALHEAKEAEKELPRAMRGPADVAAEAAYLQAKEALRINDNASARKLMSAVEEQYPKTPSAKEAGFYVGWLAFQLDDLEGATADLQAYAKKYPGTRRGDEARWFRALSFLLMKRYEEARGELDALGRELETSSMLPQVLYWSARAAQMQDPKADVAAEYARVIEQFPGTFYAVMASQRLRELGAPVPVAFPSPPEPKPIEIPPSLRVAAALSKAGLFRDAALEISEQIAGIRTAEEALRAGQALTQIGEYAAAYELANKALWGEAFGARRGEALALFYPRPFATSVEPESKSNHVDPYLTWAIMRSESIFRPDLHSAADARGLMQLIPNTAAAIAREMATPPPAPDELFSPSINLKLSTWYLGKLLERFGHPALCAAAYNAGPPVAERWAREHGKVPLDLFVELISYRETRRYVKQVLADLEIYRALYEQHGIIPPVALEVPTPSENGVQF